MRLGRFSYQACTTVAEAIAQMAEHGEDALMIAGGTVVVPMMKHRLVAPDVLVSLAEIRELRRIDAEDGRLRIGASVTHREVAESTEVVRHAPLLADACGRVASPVIRAMGTIGGNVSYGESASDPPAALLALGASVTLTGPNGTREVPLRDFYVDFYQTERAEDEVVVDVVVPFAPADAEHLYLKWTPRSREDKPLVGLAVFMRREANRCERLRVGLSGASHTPCLLNAASTALTGAVLDTESITHAAALAAAEISPFDDAQGSAEYRREMVEVWFARALKELLGEAS